ncbi:MAG: DUF4956 domain-containing protein [candidate division Zixibacteria bacterium]|nr:DUF4956 domain-containing protein [Candidatus Tariuqbacter arcticus]
MNFPNTFNPPVPYISPEEVVLNLILAFILGVLVATVYRFTSRNKALNPSFIITLVILAMVVGLVMMVIGNSIARAFSLVGALSIIRFRTVVKDNRDIAFVFFALAAGMAAGIGNYRIALYGVGIIIILILLMDFIQFGKPSRGAYLLRFQMVPTDADESSLNAIFREFLSSFNRLSVKTVRMGQYIEHSYLVKIKKGIEEQNLISRLTTVEGMERVTLVREESEGEI